MPDAVYQKQLYCMEEANKKVNSSFLDKFRGKTNKIDKNGVNHALLSDKSNIEQPQLKNQSRTHPRKLISLDSKNTSIDLSSKRTQLQEKLYNNPQRKYMLPTMSKRSTNTNIYANKLMPISPLYSPPQIPSKQQKQSAQNPFTLPPSRSISDKSQNNLPRRPFGKYLKLDEDAMKHFQFLLQLDKKRSQRKGSGVFSQR